MTPKVKICCIADSDEAAMAVAAGASAIGLVSAMPSGPGPIPEPLIRDIAAGVPEGVETFLLTSLTSTAEIVAQHERCPTTTIQIVDRLTDGVHADLRRRLPGVRLVQVIHITGDEVIEEAVALSSEVDALLFDSGRPDAAVRELGGTGRTHDWTTSRRIRDAAACPVYLAGGLRPKNVARAIGEVRPWGVDVCSGVRTAGRLDARKLALFFEEVSGALQ